MSMKEAMHALGDVSRSHIYDLERRGWLRIIRKPSYLRGPVMIPVEDINAVLAKRRAADPPA